MAIEKEDSKNRKATKNDAQVFSSVYTRITCSGRKNILRYIPYEISNTIRMKRLDVHDVRRGVHRSVLSTYVEIALMDCIRGGPTRPRRRGHQKVNIINTGVNVPRMQQHAD